MPSPIPKPASTRQRRNRHTTAATLEAGPAQKVDLPTRYSPWKCVAHVDAVRGCTLAAAAHDLEHFAKAEVEPHDFEPTEQPWHRMTVSWWKTIWASPMVAEWVDADVPDLVAIAAMWDEFWTRGDSKIHAEIRLASREFGLSPLSRRQLQWEVRRLAAPTAPAAPTTPRRSTRQTLSVLSGRAS